MEHKNAIGSAIKMRTRRSTINTALKQIKPVNDILFRIK